MKIKTDILKQIQSKKYKPVYLLHGEEDFKIDFITQAFEDKVLSDEEKSFNYTVWYGKDATAMQVIDSCMRYPMMAEKQLIILKEAQDMKTINDLIGYIKSPVASTIFVIQYKHDKIDMRKSLGKALKASAEIYESKRLYDNDIPRWIIEYTEGSSYQINDKNALLIADYLGTDLSKVSNELEKLFILIPAGAEIDSKIIEKHIGISKNYNVFELQDAIAARDLFKAQQIIHYFVDNPKKNPAVVVISSIFNFYSKLFLSLSYSKHNDLDLAKSLGFSPRNEYAARFFIRNFRLGMKTYSRKEIERGIDTIARYDLRSKGVDNVNTEAGQLLKELIYELITPLVYE